MLKSPYQQDTPQERAKYQAIRSQPADTFSQESGSLNDDEQANQYRQRRIERIRSLTYTPPEPARPCGEPHPRGHPAAAKRPRPGAQLGRPHRLAGQPAGQAGVHGNPADHPGAIRHPLHGARPSSLVPPADQTHITSNEHDQTRRTRCPSTMSQRMPPEP